MNARAQIRADLFRSNFPTASKVRLSTKKDNGRWRTVTDHEDLEPGRAYRFQAFEGQKVIGADVWTYEPEPEPVFIEPIVTDEELALLNQPIEQLDPPQDPTVAVLLEANAAQAARMDQMHRVVLELVSSVSTHAAGATGPLVKLIDQLGNSIAKSNETLTDTLNRRLKELDQREAVILQAEAEAEDRLADADAKQAQVANESAVLSGLVQHLGPEILSKLTGGES